MPIYSENAGEEQTIEKRLAELDEYTSSFRAVVRSESGKAPPKPTRKKNLLNSFKSALGSAHGKTTQGIASSSHDDGVKDIPVKAYPEGYCEKTSELMVEYTSAAYCKAHNTAFIECGCDICVPAHFNPTLRLSHPDYDSSAFIGLQMGSRNMIVASFRGTQTMTNWINNLKAVYVSARKSGFGDEFKGCKLHLGFWGTFNSIGRECVDEIARLHEVHPDYEVFVCGHSLGGAMATYCTLQVALRGIPVQGYTFGQPRTGNAKWAVCLLSV